MKKPISTAVTLGFLCLAVAPAKADVQTGMLTCRSPQPGTYVVASAQSYDCVYVPFAGAPQHYQGRLYRFGAQIGTSANTGMAWAVFALGSRPGSGSIAGNYGGVSAGAAVAIGGRANALVGGSGSSFALQPVSFEGETGLNVVASVTGLELREVTPIRRAHRHRR